MGNARYDDSAYRGYAARSTEGKTRAQVFTSRGLDPALDPRRVQFREAVDSPANPATTPIILAVDVTGSMGVLADQIVRTQLGDIMKELYSREPVSDPQIMCVAIGDVKVDRAPLQVTQFEAEGQTLTEQIKKVWLEAGGGANDGESYPLAWAFAARKTVCDAFRKRKRKGYLFTIGDEQPHTEPLTRGDLARIGVEVESSLFDVQRMLAEAQEGWHVIHLIVKPVAGQPVIETWTNLLGARAIVIEKVEDLTAAVVGAIQAIEGQDPTVGWTDDSIVTVRKIKLQLSA